MVFAVGHRVGGIVRAEAGIVVKRVSRPAGLHFIAVRAEVAAIALVDERRKWGRSARRRQRDHARPGIGAIHHAVRSALGFNRLDAGGRKIRKVKGPADIFKRHAIEQDLVVVGVAAADEQRRQTALLTGLHQVEARNLAQGIGHVGKVLQVQDSQPRDRGAHLRLGQRCAGRGNNDGFAHRLRLKRDVLLDAVQRRTVKTNRGELAKGNASGQDVEVPCIGHAQLVGAVRCRPRGNDHFAVLNQRHRGSGYWRIQRIGDHSVDQDRMERRLCQAAHAQQQTSAKRPL